MGNRTRIKRRIETEIRRKVLDFVEEIYGAWKVSPTLEMMSENVSGILGVSSSSWDQEREDEWKLCHHQFRHFPQTKM